MSPIPRNSLIFLVFLLIFTAVFSSIIFHRKVPTYIKSEVAMIPIAIPETAHLSFVGDIMLDRGVKFKVNRAGGDYRFLLEHTDFLKVPDVMFGNLEGPVSSRGANVGSIYSFRFDPIIFSVLKDAGFDALSMANNHIGDWGRLALEDTLTLGKEHGFDMIGGGLTYEDALRPRIYNVHGIKVGYLGFSDFGPPSVIVTASGTRSGVLSASDPLLQAIIRDASEQTDILVVSLHFGDEYQPRSNDRQKRMARQAIDAGADIIAGHHPHVAQEIEEYQGGLIAYSLGNFIFDQNFSEETMRGLKLDVMVDKDGIKSYSTSTVQMNTDYQPTVVE
jgi:hypothetical protein